MQYEIARNIVFQIIKRWKPEEAHYKFSPVATSEGISSRREMRQWVGHLQDVGREAHLHFIEKEISRGELDEVLSVTTLPLVLFQSVQGNAEPILAWHGKKETIHTMQEEGENWKENDIIDHNELISTLATKSDLYGDSELSKENTIYCLVPMLIEPIATPEEVKGKERTPAQRLWHLLLTEKRDISYTYIYAMIVGLLSLTLPLGVQALIGLISGGLIINSIIVLIAFVVAGTLVSGIMQIMQMSIVETLQQRLFTRAAFEFAYRIPRIRLESILNQYAPELANRFFDILTLQKGLAKLLTSVITALLQVVFGLMLLAFYHSFFIFFGLFLVAVLGLIFYLTGGRGLNSSLSESKYKYRVAYWLEELGRNQSVFKIAGNTLLPLKKMQKLVTGYLYKRKSHFRILVIQYSAFVAFKTIITGGVLILGSLLVIERKITLGQFVASEIVIISVITAVEKMILNLDVIYDTLTAVEKIGSITDLKLEKTNTFDNFNREGFDVKINGLSYTYQGNNEATLNNINLEIKPQEYIGIIGNEGAGKTTLMKIITGLFDEYKGHITFNGFTLRDLNIKNLQDYIGDNLSHEDIFEGTLLENITVGREGFNMEYLNHILGIVELIEDIQALKDGLQTQMLPSGQGFSSTFQKKVVFARSMLTHPNLIVFDDFFYNLEGSYKHRVLDKILKKDKYPWSIFAASHDPILLEKMDKIYLMKDGTIIKEGTFKELLHDKYFDDLIAGIFGN
mgnify:CR=1 FL=1